MVKNLVLETNKRDKLILIENSNLDIGLSILNESLSSFENQGFISDVIASSIIPYIKYSFKENIEIDTSSYNDVIKKVIVNYFEENNDANIHAEISGVNDDGSIKVNIYISKYVKNMFPIDEIEKDIANAISHELMHGNIYLQRYKNNKPLEDTPDYYNDSLRMFNDYGSNNIIGKFAYALYSSYYHERQAFISMTNVFIKNRIGNNKNISTKELLSVIKDSSAYNAFSNNFEVCNLLLNNKSFRDRIISVSKKYNILFDQESLMKKLKWIKNISAYSIKKIFKNAVLALK